MKKNVWNNTSLKDRELYAPNDIFDAGITNHHIANTAYPINHMQTI